MALLRAGCGGRGCAAEALEVDSYPLIRVGVVGV